MANTPTFGLAGAAGFLAFLQLNFPQLLYKPLFSCATASKLSSVREHLKIIRGLCNVMGAIVFWTQAPPEMLALVCMGDAPKERKSSDEGSRPFARDKLGKSAILLELVVALHSVLADDRIPRDEGSPLCTFARTLEDRFVLLWQAQVRKISWSCVTDPTGNQFFLAIDAEMSSLPAHSNHQEDYLVPQTVSGTQRSF